MGGTLVGKLLVMLGGDQREVILANALAAAGAELVLVGYPDSVGPESAERTLDPHRAVPGADAVIAPVSNTDKSGRVKAVLAKECVIQLDDGLMSQIAAGTPFLIGVAKPVVRELAVRYSLRLIETAEIDEIAILNSIPTAEGAIAAAMARMPVTIHGSTTLVLGFGRCGITLGRDLKALGARVTVVARNPAQRARAVEMGLKACDFDELGNLVAGCDAVFNTIPAMVVTRDILRRMNPRAVIIDIASEPGGIDFEAAAELGIYAELALGLPGKVAPVSAGRILADTIPSLLSRLFCEK